MKKDKELDLDYEIYAQMFLKKIPLAKKVNKHTYCGRCFVCGDSKFSSRKTRLYLMRERGKYPNVVICHNCHLSVSAKSFFTQHFPEDMAEMEKGFSQRDLKALAELRKKEEEEKAKDPKSKLNEEDQYLLSFDEELVRAKAKVDLFFESFTDPIETSPEAVNYMMARNVSNHFLKTFRILKRYRGDVDLHDQKKFRYAYLRDYIMIPFIDPGDNKKYYFHARRYKNLNYTSMAKYLACPYNPDDVEVSFFYNELNVTSEEPIIICEGTISSMNLPNSIATNGIGKQTEEFIRKMEWKFGGASHIIYANDNELVDRDALDKSRELLSLGKRVFLWSLMAKDYPSITKIKDFNDLCVKANKKVMPLPMIEKYTATTPVALLKGQMNVG